MQLGQLGVKSTTYNQIDKHYTPKDTHTHTHTHCGGAHTPRREVNQIHRTHWTCFTFYNTLLLSFPSSFNPSSPWGIGHFFSLSLAPSLSLFRSLPLLLSLSCSLSLFLTLALSPSLHILFLSCLNVFQHFLFLPCQPFPFFPLQSLPPRVALQ